MKMYAYEDGDFIKEVEVDVENLEEVKKVLVEVFSCGPLNDDEVDVQNLGGEVYVGIDEVQYLLNKKL